MPAPEPVALHEASLLAAPLAPASDAPPLGSHEEASAETAPVSEPARLLPLTLHDGPDVNAGTATEPFPAATRWPLPGTPKNQRKRLLPLAAGACALLALAALLVLRHHAPPPPVPVAQVTKPVAVKPPHEHKEKTHAPKPMVPPVAEALTAESVDHLGYHALAMGVETMLNAPRSDPALLLWAQWRLAAHFEDAAAKVAVGRTLDRLPLRGRVDVSSPLLVAAQAGAAISLGRLPLAKRLLIALAKSPTANRWQTWYVQTVWQARRNMPPLRLIAQLDRILRVAPNNADVRLWRAEALLRRTSTRACACSRRWRDTKIPT